MVRPHGSVAVPAAQAETHPLAPAEARYVSFPLEANSYPVWLFLLRAADEEILRTSFSHALSTQPFLAGRYSDGHIKLTNDGVPFTVVYSSVSSAPRELQDSDLVKYADVCWPSDVRNGSAPLYTVKLTKFQDGSAVLGLGRTHAVHDGSSLHYFVGDWARAARQEKMCGANSDRSPLQKAARGMDWLRAYAKREDKVENLQKTCWVKPLMNCLFPMMDVQFQLGVSNTLQRKCLFLSDAQAAAVKKAATPKPGSGGDGWVTTQEALIAQFLLILGELVLPPSSPGNIQLAFILDARKALGLQENHSLGCGFCGLPIEIEDLTKKTLPELAQFIHEELKKKATKERISDGIAAFVTAESEDVLWEYGLESSKRGADFDFVSCFNNQSKRVLPDFGSCSRGPALAMHTTSGPNILLPAEGGMNVYMHPEAFKKADFFLDPRKITRKLCRKNDVRDEFFRRVRALPSS